MYKISDNYYISANKVTKMNILTEVDGKERYFLTLADGTRHEILSKEVFDEIANASGTSTFSELVVTDKLSVGDIEDVEEEITDIRELIASDVKDIVGTYAELLEYDTTKLSVNDIIEVLEDENYGNANTMYRFVGEGEPFEYIGKLGPYYTKNEVDEKFVSEVALEIEEPTEEGESKTVNGSLTYTKGDGQKETIATFDELRDVLNTPSENTPDVTDEGADYKDQDLTLIVSDSEGNAVKMDLATLRERFIASTDNDNVSLEDAQIGQFVYETIPDEEEGD